eukprot:1148089-Pelagomonas_calceolata.AAC.5
MDLMKLSGSRPNGHQDQITAQLLQLRKSFVANPLMHDNNLKDGIGQFRNYFHFFLQGVYEIYGADVWDWPTLSLECKMKHIKSIVLCTPLITAAQVQCCGGPEAPARRQGGLQGGLLRTTCLPHGVRPAAGMVRACVRVCV